MEQQSSPPVYALPFIALKRGNYSYLLYGIGLSALAILGVLYLQDFAISSLKAVQRSHHLSNTALQRLSTAVIVVTSVLVTPVLFTAWGVPVRVLWQSGKADLETMLKLTFSTLQRVNVTLFFVVRRSGYALLAAGAVYLFYEAVLTRSENTELFKMFLGIAGVILLLVFVRIALLAFSTLLIAVGQLTPAEAIIYGPKILQGRSKRMLFDLILAIITFLGVHFLVHGGQWTMQFTLYDGIAAGFIGWYVLTLLSFNAMSALVEHLRGDGALRRASQN